MSARQKQTATTKGHTSTVRSRGGSGSGGKAVVESPSKAKRGRKNADEESDARTEAINDARDAQEEMEAMSGAIEAATPPRSPQRNNQRIGPASGTSDRAKALELKDANEKATEAEKKAAKLAAELEQVKAQLQKEKKRKEPEKNVVAVSTPPLRKPKAAAAGSRKKVVSTIYDFITFHVSCLTYIFCAQKDDGNDKLMALLSDQAVSRKIHARVVNRLLVLLGLRWSSSLHRSQISPIVQSIVVEGKLCGIDTDTKYRELKSTGMKGDFHMLQQLQHAHNKTAKNHRDKVRNLVSAMFDDSFDPMLEAIKSELFDVEEGGPIVPRDHPTLVELRALTGPLLNGMHPTIRRPSSLPARALPGARPLCARARAPPSPSPQAYFNALLPIHIPTSPLPPPPSDARANARALPLTPGRTLGGRIAARPSPRNSLSLRPPTSTFFMGTRLLFRGSISDDP